MRDGVTLRADHFRPDADGPLPTLLHRTPYGKTEQMAGGSLDASRLVRTGFNLVVQDVRGRFASAGTFEPYVHEENDSVDTLAWIARQPWSLPVIGMIGRSYGGAAQWLAAVAAPPALGAIAPEMAGGDFYDGWTYQGGVLQLGFCLDWLLRDLAHATQPLDAARDRSRELDEHLARFPDVCARPWTVLPLADAAAPYFRRWLEHGAQDSYWQNRSALPRLANVTAPSLSIGGWYDGFLGGTLDTFGRLRREARSQIGLEQSRLVIGPWDHLRRDGIFRSRRFELRSGAVDFDLTTVHVEWFRRHLCRQPPPLDNPRVRLYVMGADEWRAYDDGPPLGTRPTRLYLGGRGHGNGVRGDGTLSWEVPRAHHDSL